MKNAATISGSQFNLRHLFLLVTVAAIACGIAKSSQQIADGLSRLASPRGGTVIHAPLIP